MVTLFDNLANKLPNGWDGVGIYLKNFRSTLKENNNSVSGNNSVLMMKLIQLLLLKYVRSLHAAR